MPCIQGIRESRVPEEAFCASVRIWRGASAVIRLQLYCIIRPCFCILFGSFVPGLFFLLKYNVALHSWQAACRIVLFGFFAQFAGGSSSKGNRWWVYLANVSSYNTHNSATVAVHLDIISIRRILRDPNCVKSEFLLLSEPNVTSKRKKVDGRSHNGLDNGLGWSSQRMHHTTSSGVQIHW